MNRAASRRAAPGVLASSLLLAATLPGCTLEPGEFFAEIRPQLSVAYVAREDRVIDARWQKLASGYEVRLDRATMQLESVLLLAAGGGTAADAAFDPARPPEGYSLCHNGHCHSDDGRLVPYEEIAAEAGGNRATGPRPVLTFAAGEPFDLLVEGPGFRPLPCPAGTDCGVGRTQIGQVNLTVSALHLAGEVRTGEGPALRTSPTPFVLDLRGGPGKPLVTLQTALDLPTDSRHPPLVDLLVAVGIGAEALDGLAWPSLESADGSVSLTGDSAATSAGRLALLDRLQQAEVGGQIRRSRP
jgi:hypothetical protein